MSASAKVAYWQARCRELEAEIVKLSGKTFFCPQCEQYAKKNEELVKACKAILTNNVLVLFPDDEKLVRQALKSAEVK